MRPEIFEEPQILDLPPFVYTPLVSGTIRLLLPEPNRQPAGYYWHLEEAHLDDSRLKFDALSYTWGPLDRKFPISLNGQCAYVHYNLYTALPFLATRSKRRFRRRPFWIDAICINQADEKEKAVQIASMHRIYRMANMVWAWLGLAEEQVWMPQAVALLNRIAYVRREDVHLVGLGDLDPAVWSAIKHLLQNQWFRRVWVMQEAALAGSITFICGDHEIASNLLEQSIRSAAYLNDVFDASGNVVELAHVWFHSGIFDIRDTVLHAPGLYEHTGEASMLMEVSHIMANQDYTCLLPEDRVRGMLGLCRTPAAKNLGLHDSLDVETLYTIYGKHLLTSAAPNARWWSWLGLAFGFSRRQGLPSWAPDLHQQKPENRCDVFRASLPYHYEFSWCQASNIKTSATSGKRLNELLLTGKILDEVVMATDEIPPSSVGETGCLEVLRYLCRIADWEQAIATFITAKSSLDDATAKQWISGTGQCNMEEFWEALIGDFLKTATGPTTREAYRYFRYEMKELREIAMRYAVAEVYVMIDDVFLIAILTVAGQASTCSMAVSVCLIQKRQSCGLFTFWNLCKDYGDYATGSSCGPKRTGSGLQVRE
jgi:hypothetical protein